ncbi:MAG: hypothetical protein LC685_05795 [Actinobacteria bacterium]|nr:hypothetical protein [Actinomycetota bacterium]
MYDELWVEADPGEDRNVPLVRTAMEAAARADGVFLPVRFDGPVSMESETKDSQVDEPNT